MKISVIIPVYNEEKYINLCIKSIIKKFEDYLLEIIVVDGSCNRNTIKKINKFPVKIIKLSAPKGRGVQLNTGVNIAKGEVLIFLHVDTILPYNCKKLIEKYLKDNIILSFSLGFYNKKFFLKLVEFFGKIRCFFTNTPYGDQVFIMKKETFFKIGNFPEEDLEDVKFIKKAKKKGIKIKILKAKVKTSPRKWYINGFLKTTLENRKKILFYIFKINS